MGSSHSADNSKHIQVINAGTSVGNTKADGGSSQTNAATTKARLDAKVEQDKTIKT